MDILPFLGLALIVFVILAGGSVASADFDRKKRQKDKLGDP